MSLSHRNAPRQWSRAHPARPARRMLLAGLPLLGAALVCARAGAQERSDPIRFIDLSKFDSDLYRALEAGSSPVVVTFYEKTSPNAMPTRLQKWLSAVEKSGGRIDVEPPPDEPRPRSPALLLGLLGALWSSIKAWGEIREEAMLAAARSRHAVIALERNAAGDVVVARVIFAPRQP
jgi:hypothetical protein